jgi:hypothetical protein
VGVRPHFVLSRSHRLGETHKQVIDCEASDVRDKESSNLEGAARVGSRRACRSAVLCECAPLGFYPFKHRREIQHKFHHRRRWWWVAVKCTYPADTTRTVDASACAVALCRCRRCGWAPASCGVAAASPAPTAVHQRVNVKPSRDCCGSCRWKLLDSPCVRA